jgi:hypothetical protein
VVHPTLPTIPVALLILGVGAALLFLHRHVAAYWSRFYNRPTPTGFRYFYRYLLGPTFILICGGLALLSALTIR